MSVLDIDDVTNLLSQTSVNVQKEIIIPAHGLKLDSKDDVKKFVDDIRNCQHMTALRISGNSLGVEAAKEIGDALKGHPEFEKAYWNDMFTGRLKNEIPNALEHLGAGIMAASAGLVELELSDNAFGPNGLRGLVTFLKSSSCYTLKELKLNNNGLGIFGGQMLADCLLECHRNSCLAGKPMALKVFVCGRNRLENKGAITLADTFKAIGTLEEITMLQNFIEHEGVSAVARACLSNVKLRVLNLNDNTFTERGAASMAEVIPRLPSLEVINFGDCLIRTGGAIAICKALTANHTSLKELYLNGNEVGPDAVDSIVECLQNKDHLKFVDLDANEFGLDGVDHLRGLLPTMAHEGILGSLSNDEGDTDDEDDDDYGDNDTDDAVDEGEDSGKPPRGINNTEIVDMFLNDPTTSLYTTLTFNEKSTVHEKILKLPVDTERLILFYTQISLSASLDESEVFKDICHITDAILKIIFTNEQLNTALVVNILLTHIGLIKHEDKKFVPPSNIGPVLSVLRHNVTQPYFNKSARSILLTFIDRPHPLLEKSLRERHDLLKTLYSF